MRAVKSPPPETIAPQPIAQATGIGRVYWWLLAALLLAGVITRLIGLTQPPFDFHVQRQFWDANRARAMYYANDPLLDNWKKTIIKENYEGSTEPPILETLAVWGYRMAGNEDLAIPRAISAFAFVLAGLFLFLLAIRLMHPAGALFGTAIFLFLPFGVQASRTFQPEPLTVLFTVISFYASYRFSEQPTVRRAIWAGLFAGLAIFAKISVFFFVVGVAVALMILHMGRNDESKAGIHGWRNLLRRESLVAIAIVFIASLWYLKAFLFPTAAASVNGQAAKSFLPSLFSNPDWYASLFQRINESLTLPLLIAAVIGLFLAKERGLRAVLVGGWLGYLAYIGLFNYHTASHVYYHLPFTLIAGLSIGVLAHVVAQLLAKMKHRAQVVLTAVLLVAFGIGVCSSIYYNVARNNHPEYVLYRQALEDIGEIVQHGNVISLSIGYGYPLKFYGYTTGGFWPAQVDLSADMLRGVKAKSTEERLDDMIEKGAGYFVITDSRELHMQPELERLLATKYPVIAQEDGHYLILDLRHPKR